MPSGGVLKTLSWGCKCQGQTRLKSKQMNTQQNQILGGALKSERRGIDGIEQVRVSAESSWDSKMLRNILGFGVTMLESNIRVHSRAGARDQGCLGGMHSFLLYGVVAQDLNSHKYPNFLHTYVSLTNLPHTPALGTLFSASLTQVFVIPNQGLEASCISLLQPVKFKQKHRDPHPCIFLFETFWAPRAVHRSSENSQGASCNQALAALPSCGLLS